MGMDLEARPTQPSEGAAGGRHVVAAAVQAEDPVREALDPDLDLGGAQAPDPQHLALCQMIRARLHRESDASACGGLVAPLGGLELAPGAIGDALGTPAIHAFAKIVERIEAPLHEPDLVGGGIERPGAAQDDQLHLVHRMSDAVVRRESTPRLAVGIESVVLGPLCPRFDGEIALGHANVVGAEDAAARAGKRLRQDRDRGDATLCAYRPKPEGFDEPVGVDTPISLGCEVPKAGDDLAAREETPAPPGMALEDPIQPA